MFWSFYAHRKNFSCHITRRFGEPQRRYGEGRSYCPHQDWTLDIQSLHSPRWPSSWYCSTHLTWFIGLFACNDRVLRKIIATISVTWMLCTVLFLQAGIKRYYPRVTGCPFYRSSKHAWQVSQSWEIKASHGQGHEKRDTLYNYELLNS
jgi:hypothetical protein